MADKAFNRVFEAALAADEAQQLIDDPDRRRERHQVGEEDQMRRMTSGMTAGDAIKRILLAQRDKDYFRMLELPQPELDALGRAAWGISAAEVSKAFRRLSILVHPDKNPGEEARQAFEALNQAHRMLKDPGELEVVLRDQLERVRARRSELEGRATLEERMALNALQKEQAKALRKAEAGAHKAEILRQIQEKRERARRKREAEGKSRYRRSGDDDGGGEDDSEGERAGEAGAQHEARGGGSESDEEGAKRRRLAMAKRRQQQRKASAM